MKRLIATWLLTLPMAFGLGWLAKPTTGPPGAAADRSLGAFLDELTVIHQRELPRLEDLERQKQTAQKEGDREELDRIEAERSKINLRRRLAEDELREKYGRPPVRRD